MSFELIIKTEPKEETSDSNLSFVHSEHDFDFPHPETYSEDESSDSLIKETVKERFNRPMYYQGKYYPRGIEQYYLTIDENFVKEIRNIERQMDRIHRDIQRYGRIYHGLEQRRRKATERIRKEIELKLNRLEDKYMWLILKKNDMW